MIDYDEICRQLESLCSGVDSDITNLANAAALLYETVPDINWAGFYLVKGKELLLGPFQGKPACVRIPFGKGVCGTAAMQDKTVVVKDVHDFAGHIACDASSRSETVIPMHVSGRLYGVMDIDSPKAGRFQDEDRTGLENFARVLEKCLEHEK